MEYPKILFKSGWDNLEDYKVVLDSKEESEARELGYSALSDEKKKKVKKEAE